MAEDEQNEFLLGCRQIEFRDGYPVLDRVFRHLARTPEDFVVWVEPRRPGPAHLLVQYLDRQMHRYGNWMLTASGQDFMQVDVTVPHFG